MPKNHWRELKSPSFKTGQVLGCWTVIGPPKALPYGRNSILAQYPVRCVCGKKRWHTPAHLRGKDASYSCGCTISEQTLALKSTHRSSKTRLYTIWAGMKSRCNYQKNIMYHRYGGRGIAVYRQWMNDFSVFKEWAESNGYKPKRQLHRINNDENYIPSNCVWLTEKQHAEKHKELKSKQRSEQNKKRTKESYARNQRDSLGRFCKK